MLYEQLKKYWLDSTGLSAVEFALILPVMLSFYFGTIEVSNVMTVERRVTSVASTTADLVSQATAIGDADMADVFTAATAILDPFPGVAVQIVVSSVIDDNGATEVDWSDGHNAAPRAQGAPMALPQGLIGPGGSVIVAEVTYAYDSPFADYFIGGVTLTDTFYVKPRRVLQIPRA
jgi:Flp pilus assembly protein TadG